MADERRPGMSSQDEFVFVALGGIGEIGMNCYLYGLGAPDERQWLMVDLGITFPEGENDPGIDVILPDMRFIEENRADLAGIVITHAHEDHIGAVLDLWPRLRAPVFATPFTAALLEAKAEEERGAALSQISIVPLDGHISLTPFEIDFISVAHSIPESNALAIRTPAGTVLHTGDWKLDPDPVVGPATDEGRLRTLGDQGVDALICDSTNAIREGYSPSEREVSKGLADLIAASRGRVAVTIFASNVARIRSVADAAAKVDRHVIPVGRAMRRVIDVARETGYLEGIADFVSDDAFGYLPPDKVVALCTGSQGEPRAALSRIAVNDHPTVSLGRGDRVIFSSRTIPGNERAVNRVVNGLVRLGVEVITDRTHLVHVTGHPRRGELLRLYDWVRPRALVPVHGEELHMAEQAALARSHGVPDVLVARNGDIVRLAPGPLAIIDEAPAGRLVKDGSILVEAEAPGIRERRKLGFAGAVTVSLVLTGRGELAAEPMAAIAGLPEADRNGEDFEDIVLDAVEEVIRSLPRTRLRDAEAVEEAVRRAVRASVDQAWGKKPLCQVLVSYV
jgi:ribonuclease J